MKSYSVQVSANAEQDIRQAYLYIRQDSPNNAKRWLQSLLEASKTLATFPTRCPLAIEENPFECEVRQLVHGNYRLLYTVTEDVVVILHVRHAARNPITPNDLLPPTDN